MPRDTVLVTGGNSGIGFECARELAREGWHVLIASRNRDASRRAVQRIAEECGPDTISEASLDLGSLADVRRFAKELEAADLPLRALVCNAGLQLNDGPRLSPDGYELTFAVNHLGHFLLTHLLLPRLQAYAPARVVVVASGVHDPSLRTGMPKPAISDLETLAATGGPSPDGFDGRLAYVNSKLCNLWFTYELARRSAAAAPDVRVNAYDPGLVPGSGLARAYPPVLRFLWNHVGPGVARVASAFTPRINPAPRSGRALARMVLDPSLADVHGRYFPSHTRWAEGRSSGDSYDADRARELWEWSARTAGLATTG